MNRDDIELYVMGEHDDPTSIEAELEHDLALRRLAAGEAALEMLLRDAGAAAAFCPGCGDLAREARCNECGAAVKPGGYVVERVLVSNAHGRMYVAHDADGTQVALKELAFVQSPTLEVIAAFEREAKLLRALAHPAIPRFVASFEEGTGVHARYYLAQELVAGKSLADELETHYFSEAEATDIARQVLEVLVYLATLSPQVVHRDIKPANLVRRADGTIAVVDFGAAHVQGATAGSTSIGTFGYMPVEQLAGIVDATTDCYALGASLIHLLSRREPWRLLTDSNLEMINVSPAMRGFLAKLVAPEPRDRFATAAQASDALERAAKGERMISPKTAARTWTRPLILAAASLVFVAGGGALGYHHADDRNEAITKEVASQEDIILQGTMQMSLLSFQMCGCETKVCAEDTSEQWVTWSTELAKRERLLHDAKTLVIRGKAAERYAKCYSKHLAAQLPPEHRIPPGDPIDLAFANASLHDVLRTVGERCNASVVIPAHIESKLTINVAKVPCDQALEVLLESRGLWYEYVPEGRLLRIAERKDLDRARVEAIERAKLGGVDVPLPAGGTIDLDLKGAPLHDVIQMLAASAKLNIIVPDHIGGNVTVRLVKAPWDVAFRAILAAHGLGYTYRENGKLVRVAERNELLRELVEERERQKLR